MRIVSLLASATETVCELGAGDALVGRSHECDYPEWVRRLPSLSRPSFDIDGSSLDIDLRVRAKLAVGAPLYEIDEAALAALAPDVLLTQTHCEVCAVTPGDIAPGLCRQPVVALRSGTLHGILEGFEEVARVLGVPDRGVALARRCRATVEAVRTLTRTMPRVRVACLEWIDPVFAMGNWGPELVEAAGGESVLGRPGEHSTTLPWEAVVREDPDVLVVAVCGFGIDRTASEMHVMESRPRWRDLRAVREGRVFVADGNRFFNRSGPSAFETAELLAEMLHRGSLEPKHEARDWRAWK